MKADVPTMDERRLAALTLHGLSPADRAWVMERLGRRQRDELEPLLSELSELGIPSDRSLVSAVLTPSAPPVEISPLQRRTLRVEPQAFAKMLMAEPTTLAARCLSLLDVTQREDVMRGLSAEMRAGIAADPIPDAPALTAAIEKVIAARLPDVFSKGAVR